MDLDLSVWEDNDFINHATERNEDSPTFTTLEPLREKSEDFTTLTASIYSESLNEEFDVWKEIKDLDEYRNNFDENLNFSHTSENQNISSGENTCHIEESDVIPVYKNIEPLNTELTKTLKYESDEDAFDTKFRPDSQSFSALKYERSLPSQENLERTSSCSVCKEKFATKFELFCHERQHTGMKLHNCKNCERSFVDIEDLLIHEAKNCLGKSICLYCGKGFSRKYDLFRHERIHTGCRPYQCRGCYKSFSDSSNWVQHELTHGIGKLYSCAQCNRSFRSRNKLETHELKHTVRTFYCEICDVSFPTSASLSKHSESHAKKRYSCKLCNKTFLNKGSQKHHLNLHSGDNLFKCSTCSKTFSTKNSLSRHEIIHSGLKPYVCSFCGKGFSDRSNMAQHQQVHIGPRIFACSMCPEFFKTRSKLASHFTKHDGAFTCPFCPQKFNSISDLTRHESVEHVIVNLNINLNDSEEGINVYNNETTVSATLD